MIPSLKNFRTYQLALTFHKECKTLQLSPYLKDQLMRATQGIVLTLSEGSAKISQKERVRYYGMAFASFRECQSILDLADEQVLREKFDLLGACLYRLIKPKT